MKSPLLLLLPSTLAPMMALAHATPPAAVYILMPSNPALSAVSSALNTLGYTEASPANGLELGGTYAVLEPGSAYKNISLSNPDARFILPSGTTTLRQQQLETHDADAIRAFFAEMDECRTSRLLELDVFASASHEQAQTWVALCDFLGLGYSVVERLKLWHFPK